jgi:hypothetical protein
LRLTTFCLASHGQRFVLEVFLGTQFSAAWHYGFRKPWAVLNNSLMLLIEETPPSATTFKGMMQDVRRIKRFTEDLYNTP